MHSPIEATLVEILISMLKPIWVIRTKRARELPAKQAFVDATTLAYARVRFR